MVVKMPDFVIFPLFWTLITTKAYMMPKHPEGAAKSFNTSHVCTTEVVLTV